MEFITRGVELGFSFQSALNSLCKDANCTGTYPEDIQHSSGAVSVSLQWPRRCGCDHKVNDIFDSFLVIVLYNLPTKCPAQYAATSLGFLLFPFYCHLPYIRTYKSNNLGQILPLKTKGRLICGSSFGQQLVRDCLW